MRGSRILAAVVLTGAALGTAAPALADGTATGGDYAPNNLQVFPKTVKQGGKLTVTVDGGSCRQGNAYVESKAFPRVILVPLRTEGAAYATPYVFRHAHPGAYTITAVCKGKSVSGARFTVVHGHGPQGGEGGSVRSMSTTEAALGAGLVAAAVAGGVCMMRRRMGSGGM
ncbi:hypothetical protein GCM10027168_06820 [Streptomyces capparidis]